AAADKTVAELRAAPSQAGIERLAQRLAEQAWRWRDQRQAREAAAVSARHGTAISAVSLRDAAQPELRPLVGGEHAIEPIPHDELSADSISLRAVRVECWRYRYDPRWTTLT